MVERFSQEMTLAVLERGFQRAQAGEDKDVSLEVLLQAATLRDPSFRLGRAKRRLGEELLHPPSAEWENANQGFVQSLRLSQRSH